MIESIVIKNFTAFKELSLNCSEGLNIFIGANSTGKSHLLKLMYAVCSANKPVEIKHRVDTVRNLMDKINGVFKPEEKIGRLCHNESEKTSIRVNVMPGRYIEFGFSIDMDEVVVTDNHEYEKYSCVPIFIPPKEMLSSFPGFTSLYLNRDLEFDETYFDLCQALEMPILKGEPAKIVTDLLNSIKKSCEGEFLLTKQKRFYYKPDRGRMLEVELAAEGFRKIGTLQRLLQNGRILPGVSGPLFWDEPEANINPSLMKQLIKALLELSRNGQQIFLATHDYVVLKLFDLIGKGEDKITFHALYKNDDGEIAVNSTQEYLQIHPNAVADTFADLYDMDLQRALRGTEDDQNFLP